MGLAARKNSFRISIMTVLACGLLLSQTTARLYAQGTQDKTDMPPAPAAVATLPATAASAHSFNYSVDATLTWSDRLARADAGSMATPQAMPSLATSSASVEQPRTLGLSRFRAGFEWLASERASLTAVLRPDALQRSTHPDASTAPHRDFDRRSGESYRPMPTLQLLDAYQISYKLGRFDAGLALSAGVWEELAPTRLSYPELLGFGLQVHLPAKFAGVRLRVKNRTITGPQPMPAPSTGYFGDLYLIEGDEDRAEQTGSKRGTHDQAAVAQDPYHGLAAYGGWIPHPAWEFGLLVGSLESTAQDAQQEIFLGTKRSDFFVEMVSVFKLPLRGRTFKLSLDLRHEQEKWSGGPNIPSRVQQSVSLTTATLMLPDIWLLFGAHLGKSERASAIQPDKKVTYAGYQAELGVLAQLTSELDFRIMSAQERRDLDEEGTTRGGFSDGDNDSDHHLIRRICLEVAYALNQNR